MNVILNVSYYFCSVSHYKRPPLQLFHSMKILKNFFLFFVMKLMKFSDKICNLKISFSERGEFSGNVHVVLESAGKSLGVQV